MNIFIKFFRTFFPEPTEEQLLAKAEKLLVKFKYLSLEKRESSKHQKLLDDIATCEKFMKFAHDAKPGQKMQILKVNISFIKYYRTLHTYF